MNHVQQRTYSLFTVSFTAFRRSSHHLSVRLLEPNPLAVSPQSHLHTYWLRPSPTNRIIECFVTSCGKAVDVRGEKREIKWHHVNVGKNNWVCKTECFSSPVDLSAAHVGRRRGRIQRGYQSRSEWGNILKLPVGASCHCTAATGRSHSVQLILARACEDQSQCYHQKKVENADLSSTTKRKMIQIDKRQVWTKRAKWKIFRGNWLVESKACTSQRNQKFFIKMFSLNLFTQLPRPPKTHGRRRRAKAGI